MSQSMMASTSKAQTETKEPYQYAEDYPGPYIVFVDTIRRSPEHRKPISGIMLGDLLRRLLIMDIHEIREIGFERCRVTFKTRKAANSFVMHRTLKENGYTAEIPEYLLKKRKPY